ncbi:TIGR03364 family FAD-dependent oxidoreductase [Flavobacterium sp. '19STA2R22 D10 B1']|uniref:TIGR03364 family FAD-dependent oxidoreductase n=1 Tax=Flavobacterium aerium TaxID=3037261 RepID=UPI00278C116A|nr:TIGR03364 family FAD-dependent oxidoreductase [Flavobacterium sp. '19STA2R22 D10 B1']
MSLKHDLLIVGGGALGAFHAYHAIQRGLKVILIEKNSEPQGATVRNFGQVVPSGMDQKWQNYGRESLSIYKELQQKFDLTVRQNGSVYLASNPEELTLIEELYAINKSNGYASQLLTKEECLNQYTGLKSSYCVGGLFFPEEVTVEPRVMINRLLQYLISEKGLEYRNNTTVVHCETEPTGATAILSNGQKLSASKIIICSGHDFKILFPEEFNASDLEVSKLQMMQTKPQSNYTLNGSILTGLSIRRYESFSECPSWDAIKSKEPKDSIDKKWGVHILFKQAADGSVIIGDSHEYKDAKESDELGFDCNEDINDYMIAEAKKIIELPDWSIQHKWFGLYSQCKSKDIFMKNIGNIHIVTGIGGKGMTGSAGFAKHNLETIL